MAVSKRLRYEILRRDNHSCQYCGQAAPDVKLTVDHVLPVALGGSDDPSNLTAACADCNSGKSATPPAAPLVDAVHSDAIRWAAAMKRAAEMLADEREAAEDEACMLEDWFRDEWSANFDWVPDLQPHHMQSLTAMRRAGITTFEIGHAVRVASERERQDVWSYFCGVAWKLFKQRQEVAYALLADGEA